MGLHDELQELVKKSAFLHNTTELDLLYSLLAVDDILLAIFGAEKILELLGVIADLRNLRGKSAGRLLAYVLKLDMKCIDDNFTNAVLTFDLQKLR